MKTKLSVLCAYLGMFLMGMIFSFVRESTKKTMGAIKSVVNPPWNVFLMARGTVRSVRWNGLVYQSQGHPTLITFPLQPQRPQLALALAPAPALALAALALALALTQVLIVSLNQILITSGGSHSTPPKTQFHVPLGETVHTMYM